MSEIEKIPFQMSEYEVYMSIALGIDPVQTSIIKYKKFKEWCQYKIKENDWECIRYSSEIYSDTCPLCIVNMHNCNICELANIKQECFPDKVTITPWRRVKYAIKFIDETEERQEELFDAINNMIEVLEECKNIEE